MKKVTLLPCILLLLFLSSGSCKKKKNQEEFIPYVYVDFYIPISNPQFINLNAVGGWVYVTGGSKGIIIYRKSNDEFGAYDRHCPFMPENSCSILKVSSSGTTAIDTCCGSEFLLIDGSVLKAPSNYPMLRYQTLFDGNQLHIFN
jgi:nitrite reductase/ring-hydroxylating ferredoxin subunit